MVFACGGGTATAHLIMPANKLVVAQHIPVGVKDLRITLKAEVRTHMFLWDEVAGAYIVRDRSNALGTVHSSSTSGTYKGLHVSFGRDGGHESVVLAGTVPLQVSLRVESYSGLGDQDTATLNFSHGGLTPCPKAPFGCEHFPASSARAIVSSWSRALRTKFSSGHSAWAALAEGAAEPPRGVPWHKWMVVWNYALSWPIAFRFLDTDDNDFISEKECETGFSLTNAMCPSGYYRSSALLFECSGGKGTAKFTMAPNKMEKAADIPEGVVDLKVALTSDVDVDMYLWDYASETYVLHWKVGVVNEARRHGLYKGMQVSFSGDDRTTPIRESFNLSGAAKVPTGLRLFNYAKEAAAATVNYEYSRMEHCHGAVPAGCSPYDPVEAEFTAVIWSRMVCKRHGSEREAWAAMEMGVARASDLGLSWHDWVGDWDHEEKWKLIFRFLDKDSDSYVSPEEFKRGYQLSGSNCGSDGITGASNRRVPVPACPEGFYRAAPLVFDCGGGAALAHWIMPRESCGSGCQVQDIPPGLMDLKITLRADGGAALSLWDHAFGKYILHASKGVVSDMARWGTYNGLYVHFGGQDKEPPTNEEYEFMGRLPVPASLRLENGAGAIARVALEYRYGKLHPCPAVPAGCEKFDLAAAKHAVEDWSMRIHDTFHDAEQAWTTYGTHGVSPQGLSWHEWAVVGNFSSTWQEEFRYIDANSDSLVTHDEFLKGFYASQKQWPTTSGQRPITTVTPDAASTTTAPVALATTGASSSTGRPAIAATTTTAETQEEQEEQLQVLLSLQQFFQPLPGASGGPRRLARGFSFIDANASVRANVVEVIRADIVKACDSKGITQESVSVQLASGFYNVKGLVTPPSGSSAKSLEKSCCSQDWLGQNLPGDIAGVPGIDGVLRGRIRLASIVCSGSAAEGEAEEYRDVVVVGVVFGVMALILVLAYLAIWEDGDIRFYVWSTISSSVSVFIAALAFPAVESLLALLAKTVHGIASVVVAYGVFAGVFAALQAAIGAACAPSHHGRAAAAEEKVWVIADFNKKSYGQIVPTKEVRPSCDVKSIAFYEGREVFVKKVRLERELQLQRIKSYVAFLAHVAAFAAILAGGTLQHLVAFGQFPPTALVPVLLNQVVLFALLRSAHVGRAAQTDLRLSSVKAGGVVRDVLRDPLLDEEVHEAESDLASLTCSFLFVQALRFLISGHLPGPGGVEEPGREHGLLSVLVLLVLGLGFGAIGTTLAYMSRRHQPMTWHRRLLRAWQNTSAMCFAWCLLWALRWELGRLGAATLAGQTTLSLVFSLVSLALICALATVEDIVGSEKMGEVIQSVITALSVLIGFSWSLCFSVAAAGLAGADHQWPLWRLEIHKLLLAALGAVLLLPAWRRHLVDKVLRYRQMRADILEAQAAGQMALLSVVGDDGFWDEGLGRSRAGGSGGANVWRFYRRQDGKWDKALANSGTPASMVLQVQVKRASNLRNSDWMPLSGQSDPYCICEVPGMPEAKFRTMTVKDDLNPVWNHVHEIKGYDVTSGEPLLFTVSDEDMVKKANILGRAYLTADKFLPNGYEGDLPLADAGKGIKATLRVSVKPMSAAFRVTDPMQLLLATEDQPRPSGWYSAPLGIDLRPLG